MRPNVRAPFSTRPWLSPEWSPQSGIMLTWPHAGGDWGRGLAAVERVYIELASAITRFESLLIGCHDENHLEQVRMTLGGHGISDARLKLYSAPSNDVWIRDHGPVTVLVDGEAQLLDFEFNGWGNRYSHDLDNQVTRRLHVAGAFGSVPLHPVDMVLEGGSIDVDGSGTLLTTSRCLLAPARGHTEREPVEDTLAHWLGIERVLWLENGYLEGDDTDAHIDNLARFCNAHTLCYASCSDPGDPQYQALQAMAEELIDHRDHNGSGYSRVALPLPQPLYNAAGRRLPASYVNFLILNGAVLVPVYDDPNDAIVLERLRDCFPGREVIAIRARALVMQYGSIHCATMQLPEGVL